MLKKLALIVAFAFAVPACAAVVASLPTIVAAVTDGLMVVDSIKQFVDTYFKVQPNIALEGKVEIAITRVRQALHVALRATKGTEKLTQEQVDAAFAEFRAAYAELLVLVGPLGVTTGDTLRATPGALSVPEPMALTLTAR